jgi:hypothetical protein
VQVVAAYLNPAEQVAEVRMALARLAEPGAPADEPDIGAYEGADDNRRMHCA